MSKVTIDEHGRDLSEMPDMERIKLLSQVAATGQPFSFIVEDDSLVPGKCERYLRELKRRHPAIKIVEKREGPLPQTVFVKMQLTR